MKRIADLLEYERGLGMDSYLLMVIISVALLALGFYFYRKGIR